MALLKDIQNKLNDPNLNPKQRANLQKQLAGAQGKPVPVSTTSNVTKPTAVGTEIGKVTNQQQPVTQPVQPTQVQPTTTPTQPQQPTTPQQPIQGGLDETKLLASGITQEQIDKMKAIMGPTFQANQNDAVRAGQQNEFVQKDIADAKKETDTMYEDIKKRKEDLVNESLQINDQSAKVQGDLAAQEYQKNNFDNIQAQKQFDLDQAKNKAKLQKQTDDNELGFRRAMGAQLGGSFSSEGIYRLVQVKQEGAQAVSDLESQTAIGDSQFAFKAQEISSSYYNKLGTIELDRKAQALTLKSDLNDQLDEIDAKMLASDDDKRKQARDAMTEYFNKLNEVDHATAQATSEANKALFDEKKQLEQEKKEKESVDLSMSQGLGYFANKFGDPIGVRPGEPPKRFVGNFDEGLSKQFGYLVDARGNAMLGTDGKKIDYTDFSLQEHESALSSLLSGAATGYEKASLNGKVGVNNYIRNAVKAGSKGGQCGTFVRTRFTNEAGWEGECQGLKGNAMNVCSRNWKQKVVNKRGFQVGKGVPKVGDIAVFTGSNYGSVGHYAIISEISEDGKTMQLTESNLDLHGTVTTNRRIPTNAKGLYGFFTPNQKKEVIDSQPNFAPPGTEESDSPKEPSNPVMEQLKNLRISSPEYFKELIKDAKPEDIIKMQQGGVFDTDGSSGNKEYDINKFKGDAAAYLALPDEERKRYQEIYSDNEIKSVLSGKDISQAETEKKTKLPADKVVMLEDAKFLPTTLDALEKTISGGKGTFDPIWGNIDQWNPWAWSDTEKQTVNAELRTAAQLVGKYMEGGVLRMEDEIKYRNMLPNPQDTREIALAKLKQIRNMLKNKTEGYIKGFDASGYDVGTYMDQLSSLTQTGSDSMGLLKLKGHKVKRKTDDYSINDSTENVSTDNTDQYF